MRANLSTYLSTRRARRADRAAERAQERRTAELLYEYGFIWRPLCEFTGLVHSVDTVTGATVLVPQLSHIDETGDHLALVVKLLPGQLPKHFAAVADQLAPHLDAEMVRIVPRGRHWIRIELYQRDPLDVPVMTDVAAAARFSVIEHPILIGQDEAGAPITQTWAAAPHTCIQGRTRSGKSVWCYSVLAQLAALSDVLIAGSDLSGLLLGRPFAGTRHEQWQATGSRDVLAHLTLLHRLVEEMDERITDLPDRADKIERFTPDRPLVLVVLEEFAGLLRLASTLPAPRGEAKIRDQLLSLYGRLVSEGHKAGFRLLVVTQRADATIVGGFERGQLATKISFAVDDDEALPMLHGSAGRPLVDEHRYAPPGVALLDSPTHRLVRVRGPRLPGPDADADYARYWDEITAATACRRPHAA